jgi:hypothetical protein
VTAPAAGTPCPIAGCGADDRGTFHGGPPMLCRGYGHNSDPRCRANWMSADPEDWGRYEDYLREVAGGG